jgi:lipopolysaccharide transport system permease protein
MTASRATAPLSNPARPADSPAGRPHLVAGRRPGATPDVSWSGLVWTLVRTDFKARYHGTAGGFFWALLKPAAMFAVLVTVFSLVFPAEPTYKLDLIVGLFLYDFFTDATKTGITALSSKAFLLSKARLPRYILVLTSATNALLTLVVFASVVVVYLALTGRGPGVAAVAAFAAYLAALAGIVTGISLASSVLFLRYRDLNQVWDMATQAGFFIAPIIYPLGVIPERFHIWLYLWPPTPVIEFARAALIDGVLPSSRGHLSLLLMTSTYLVVGALIYRRYAPRAAEYV